MRSAASDGVDDEERIGDFDAVAHGGRSSQLFYHKTAYGIKCSRRQRQFPLRFQILDVQQGVGNRAAP